MPALAASSLSPLLLLLLHVAPGTASNLPGPSPPKGPYHPAALRSFISARCGGDVPPDRERGARQAASDGASSPTDSPPPPPPPPPPADAPTSAVWAYEGALVDPSNGHTVAQVEGIELCRHLSEVPGGSDPQLRRERGMRRMGDLRARDMLQQERQAWDFATTILSRRLFVYRAPSSAEEDMGAPGCRLPDIPGRLRSVRLRPTSPEKRLGLDETVALYDVATTYVSRDGGKSMAILSEFPDGSWIMGNCDGTAAGGAVDSFDFAVFARMGNRDKKADRGSAGDSGPTLPPLRAESSDGVVISPPRSRFIQFGKDDNVERSRYGARETYSFENMLVDRTGTAAGTARDAPASAMGRLGRAAVAVGRLAGRAVVEVRFLFPGAPPPPDLVTNPLMPTVRYTRFGESPPWYRPSQPATLELKGKRLSSIDEAPSLVAGVASRYVPGFLVVDCPIPSGSHIGEDCGEGGLGRILGASRKLGVGAGAGSDEVNLLRRSREDLADAAAARAVEYFRDPPSNGGEIVTLLDERGYDEDEYYNAILGEAESRTAKLKRRFARRANRAFARGSAMAERVWDATQVTGASELRR